MAVVKLPWLHFGQAEQARIVIGAFLRVAVGYVEQHVLRALGVNEDDLVARPRKGSPDVMGDAAELIERGTPALRGHQAATLDGNHAIGHFDPAGAAEAGKAGSEREGQQGDADEDAGREQGSGTGVVDEAVDNLRVR